MATNFADLDELVLTCRDIKAKGYISEAVASYRAGAYRSAIVSTWIAICYDVIDKIRELALSGDTQAEQFSKDIEKARINNDINASLKIEREILLTARDKFEFISHIEFTDLQRIQEDRNRCAHPSLATEEQIFSPSAELARLHIRVAITHVLAHPPAQGKYALERILNEVNSEYFPITADKAKIAFENSPLKKPRQSLVRNLTVILFKELLDDNLDWKRTSQIGAALEAIKLLHFDWYDQTLQEKASNILENLKDQDLAKLHTILIRVNGIWNYFSEAFRDKCITYVKNLPLEQFEDIDFYLTFTYTKSAAEFRVKISKYNEYTNLFFFETPTAVRTKFIDSYLDSNSFDTANAWSKLIANNSIDFSAEEIIKIITNISKNSQITGSFELPSLISKLRSISKIDENLFNNHLKDNGLSEYIPQKIEENVEPDFELPPQ